MKNIAWRWVRGVALAAVVVTATSLLVAGGAYLYIEHGGNLHTVEVGRVYRSAQLSGPQLHQVVAEQGIKTVLNLRGANSGSGWYDEEVLAAKTDGLNHIDYPLSARRELSPAQMQDLVSILRDAPKPILIHCKSGSDRTGLVAALYQLSRGKDAATAEQELSLRFGHFPYLGSKTIAMDRSLDVYVHVQRDLKASAPR